MIVRYLAHGLVSLALLAAGAALPASASAQDGSLVVAVLEPPADSPYEEAIDMGRRIFEARLTSSGRFALLADNSALSAIDASREEAGVSPEAMREALLEAARRGYADLAVELSMLDSGGGAWLVSIVVYTPGDGNGVYANSELVEGAESDAAAARLGLDALATRMMTAESITRLEGGGTVAAGGRLQIGDSEPRPVRVFVNNRDAGLAPGIFVGLPTGPVEIEFRADGYASETRTLELRSNSVYEIGGVALDPAQIDLEVRANIAGASILVDGEAVGETVADGWVTVQVPALAQAMRIVSPGYQPWAGRLQLLSGESPQIEVALQRRDGPDGQDATTADCRTTAPTDRSRLCHVPAGEALMGSRAVGAPTDVSPDRLVTLTAGFRVQRSEVSVSAWERCVAAGACPATGTVGASGAALRTFADHNRCNADAPGRDDHPMNCVNWYAAADYCAWAGGALPTEAQWERAARGTDGRDVPWTLEAVSAAPGCDLACSSECETASDGTSAVGEHPDGASPYGLLDVAGNVAEWTLDTYESQAYAVLGDTDPVNDAAGARRVLRGGSFADLAEGLFVWSRARLDANARAAHVGFRCVFPE